MKTATHRRNHGGFWGWLAAGVAAAGALGGLAFAGRAWREEQNRRPRWAHKLSGNFWRRTPAKRLHL